MLDERTWRTGVGSTSQTTALVAAREARSVTSWRSYRRADAPDTALWIQVTPFVDASDAQGGLLESRSPTVQLTNGPPKPSRSASHMRSRYPRIWRAEPSWPTSSRRSSPADPDGCSLCEHAPTGTW